MKIWSQCSACKHLLRTEVRGRRCPAFPDGIPEDIYYNKRNHAKPYPGDHGVRWEALNEEVGQRWEEGVRRWEEYHGHAWGEPDEKEVDTDK